MNRRSFIKQAVKAGVLSLVPTILPSGRLFALTGDRKVEHVVLCLFAGGIRTFESIDKSEGNLMPNLLYGEESISTDIRDGISFMPRSTTAPIQQFGTLFKGFRYNSRVVRHYNGHASCITGHYCNTIEMMKPVQYPTMFELFRRHSMPVPDAINTWWVSDQGGPFPYLQYSNVPDYGQQYGANMIQPSNFFRFDLSRQMEESQRNHARELYRLLAPERDEPFGFHKTFPRINSPQHQQELYNLIARLYENHFKEGVSFWGLDKEINDDFINIFTATEILQTFRPNLLVVNMQDSDIGHSNFTAYCSNLHKADYALGKLWQTIQDDPALRDNTVLIAVPEFGRNLEHNTIMDEYGRYAVDHTGDEISQRMFCLIAGPSGVVQQNKTVETPYGETPDILATVAHLLGFRHEIPSYYLQGRVLYEALV